MEKIVDLVVPKKKRSVEHFTTKFLDSTENSYRKSAFINE
jgi:hypothetical protein